MLKKTFASLALAVCSMQFAGADVLQLKDKAAVTGKILAEKRGEVIVDVGYTWLIIPRSQILRISKSNEVENATVAAPTGPVTPAAPAEVRAGHYQSAGSPPPIRDVRELVNLLGEAVV